MLRRRMLQRNSRMRNRQPSERLEERTNVNLNDWRRNLKTKLNNMYKNQL